MLLPCVQKKFCVWVILLVSLRRWTQVPKFLEYTTFRFWPVIDKLCSATEGVVVVENLELLLLLLLESLLLELLSRNLLSES